MSVELPSTHVYSTREYWEQRFQVEQSYEWLGDLSLVWPWIRLHLGNDKNIRILHLGCGTSGLSTRMLDDGYKHITNLDYSRSLVDKFERMQPQFEWVCADMRNMHMLDTGTFDVVIEKAGIDTICAAESDPWHRSPSLLTDIHSTLTEVSRILTVTGRFLSITFDQPHFRLPMYAKSEFGWQVNLDEVGDELPVFCYWMQKGKQLELNDWLRAKLYPLEQASRQAGQPVVHLQPDYDDKFLFGINTA